MPTKGRYLENLVAFIQHNLAPQGAKITSPERFFRNGKQIGEIDITIRGQFGSSTVFVGVECRDRPADGPQGVPWISAIVGKRETLAVDKMIAVSSTGFAPEAIEEARRQRVDTLTAKDITGDTVEHFMRMAEFAICVQSFEHVNFSCTLSEDRTEYFIENLSKAYVVRPPDTRIPFSVYFARVTEILLESWDPRLENEKQLSGSVMTFTREEPFSVFIDDEQFNVRQLIVTIKVWREVKKGKVLLTLCEKANSGEVLSYVGVCKTTFGGNTIEAFVSIDELNCKVVRVTGQFVDESGGAYFPAGTKIDMRMFASNMSWSPKELIEVNSITTDTRAPRVAMVMHFPSAVRSDEVDVSKSIKTQIRDDGAIRPLGWGDHLL